jgi:UDP-N-acetylmuramoyl-L-alanyl-D-glutamate--2,6-diaminopimelate ligase
VQIIDQLRSGMPAGAVVTMEPDRAVAIAHALSEAGAGDVVVIAGKGHEAVQVVGDEAIPFDDREVARRALRALRGSGSW